MGLRRTLQPLGFRILIFSIQPLTLWVAQVPHTLPLSVPVTWVPALPSSVSAETEGAHKHSVTASENPNSVWPFSPLPVFTLDPNCRSQAVEGIPRKAIIRWNRTQVVPLRVKKRNPNPGQKSHPHRLSLAR